MSSGDTSASSNRRSHFPECPGATPGTSAIAGPAACPCPPRPKVRPRGSCRHALRYSRGSRILLGNIVRSIAPGLFRVPPPIHPAPGLFEAAVDRGLGLTHQSRTISSLRGHHRCGAERRPCLVGDRWTVVGGLSLSGAASRRTAPPTYVTREPHCARRSGRLRGACARGSRSAHVTSFGLASVYEIQPRLSSHSRQPRSPLAASRAPREIHTAENHR